jgi:hypothetical protein
MQNELGRGSQRCRYIQRRQKADKGWEAEIIKKGEVRMWEPRAQERPDIGKPGRTNIEEDQEGTMEHEKIAKAEDSRHYYLAEIDTITHTYVES